MKPQPRSSNNKHPHPYNRRRPIHYTRRLLCQIRLPKIYYHQTSGCLCFHRNICLFIARLCILYSGCSVVVFPHCFFHPSLSQSAAQGPMVIVFYRNYTRLPSSWNVCVSYLVKDLESKLVHHRYYVFDALVNAKAVHWCWKD